MLRTCMAALFVSAALAAPVAAQPYNLTVSGYSPGGLVSTVGAGLDAAVSAEYPGSAITYQTSSGGLANALLLQQGKTPLGMAQDVEAAVALAGKPPFKAPVKELRMIAHAFTPESRFQLTHFLVSRAWAEKYGVQSVEDIAKKRPPMRIALNRPGNMDGNVSIAALEAAGVKLADIAKWGGQVIRAASGEQTSLMLDRRIDVISFGISYKHPRVQEVANGLDIVMLTMSEDTAKKAAAASGAKVCHVKGAEYDFLKADTASLCVGMLLLANQNMDEKTAYNLAKAFINQVERFKGAHRLLAAATTKESLSQPSLVPFHPGAAKFYKEAGLLK